MDRKQKIWLQNTGLALTGALILTALVIHAHITDRSFVTVPALTLILLVFWSGCGVFVGIISSGISRHWADGSLTYQQMTWATITTLVAMSLTSTPRVPFYFLIFIVMIFGIFRLPIRQYYYFALFSTVAAGIQQLLGHIFFAPSHNIADAIFAWVTFVFSALILVSLAYSYARLQRRLKERNEELKQALGAKDAFLANMSHEMRTPLNGILGLLRTVLNSPLSEEQERKLKLAKSSGDSLVAIINDILDFSKIEANKFTIIHEPFNPINLIGDIADSMSLAAEEKGIELYLDMARLKLCQVEGDALRVRQVLTNLIGNAIKFTDKGHVIVRAWSETQGDICFLILEVEDTGMGIANEHQKTLFDAFTQVDDSSTRHFGGTGLGLTITKRLCELMGGQISVTSEPGSGSCFKVKLRVESAVEQTHNFQDISVLVLSKHDDLHGLLIKKQLDIWELDNHCIATRDLNEAEIKIREITFAFPWLLIVTSSEWSDYHCDQLIKYFKAPPFKVITLGSAMDDTLGKPVSATPPASRNLHLFKPVSPQTLKHALNTNNQESDSITEGNMPKLQGSILVVEDNLVNQEVIQGLLSDLGLECSLANNGVEAMDTLNKRQTTFDVILMDCQMPVMDGFETTRHIRAGECKATNSATPIIALTANTQPEDREKCRQAGMNDFISKPIDPETLRTTLGSILIESSETSEKYINNTYSQQQESANQEIWDRAAALKRVRDKMPRLLRLVSIVLDTLPEKLLELKDADQRHDYKLLSDTAHSIKGVAANMGANALMHVVANLENAARKESEYDLELVLVEGERLLSLLKDFMKENSTSEEN